MIKQENHTKNDNIIDQSQVNSVLKYIQEQLDGESHQPKFIFEKAIITRIYHFQHILKDIKSQVSNKILQKADFLQQKIPTQLKQKILLHSKDQNQHIGFKCKYCDRKFKDGRQLGGHISRAHSEFMNQRRKEKKKEKMRKSKIIKKASNRNIEQKQYYEYQQFSSRSMNSQQLLLSNYHY